MTTSSALTDTVVQQVYLPSFGPRMYSWYTDGTQQLLQLSYSSTGAYRKHKPIGGLMCGIRAQVGSYATYSTEKE